MALIVDFLLLAASGAACFYCWVLNTRIKALTNTKDGIHTGIAALSQSAEEMQNAMASTKDQTVEDSTKLDALINEANKKIPELESLASQIQEISERAVEETEAATKHLIETLSPHIEKARTTAHFLLDSLEKAPSTPSTPVNEISGAEERIEPDAFDQSSVEDDDIEVTIVAEDESQLAQGEVA